MSMQGDPDATIPVPGAGEPFPGADATQPVTRAEYGGPGEPPPGGGDGGEFGDGEDDDGNRRLWMIAGAVLLVGLLVGGAVALLAGGGDDDKADTTTTSSSTSTTTTSTTLAPSTLPPSTSAAGPQVLQFTVNNNPVNCPNNGTVNVVLTWSTQNAESATISIDNPNGPYGTYGPSGQQQVPFACSVNPLQHTYYLTANGFNGQKDTESLEVNGSSPPSTTTSTTN